MPDATDYKFPDELDNKKPATQGAEDKIEIEVLDDTPPADRNRTPMNEPPKEVTDEELAKYDEGIQKRIKHFSKGYHEERRAKEAALREREEAIRVAQAIVEENKKLRGSLSTGHQALLAQAKNVVQNEINTAKQKYKAAAEAFDSEAMLAAQEELTNLKIRADKIENFQPEALRTPEVEVKLPTLDQHPTAPKLDERLADWQEKNRWFGKDKKMTAYALSVHEELVESGVPAGSDQYYKRLNDDLRERFPDKISPDGDDANTRRQRGSVVAPATRSTAPKKIVLTQSQVQIAKRLGVPLELYARKVAEEMRKSNG